MQSFMVKTEFTRTPTCVELLCWVYVNRSYISKVKYMIGIGFKTRAHTAYTNSWSGAVEWSGIFGAGFLDSMQVI